MSYKDELSNSAYDAYLQLINDKQSYEAVYDKCIRTLFSKHFRWSDVVSRVVITYSLRRLGITTLNPYERDSIRKALAWYYLHHYNDSAASPEEEYKYTTEALKEHMRLFPNEYKQAEAKTNLTSKEEIEMSYKVETRVFIGETLAKDVTDDAIFGMIAKLEKDVESLEKTKARPKKLQAKIDSLKQEIADLVKYVDERGVQ